MTRCWCPDSEVRQTLQHALMRTSLDAGWEPVLGKDHASRGSERIPGRLRRELQIADIRAKSQADAGADWNHHDAVRGQRRHADAPDQIRRAVDAGEALIDRPGGGQVVDEHHRARAFAADVPAKRRALPVDFQVAGVLGVERALAITKAADERAAALLPKHI